jgi:hypothetical protein
VIESIRLAQGIMANRLVRFDARHPDRGRQIILIAVGAAHPR